MEPNTTPGTSPELNATPAPAEPAKKSKGLLFTTIIFAVLAIAGTAFGVYGMFFQPKPTCETNCTSNTDSQSTDSQPEPAPTIAEATELLEEKYGLMATEESIGHDYLYIDVFDQGSKIAFVISNLNDDEIGTWQTSGENHTRKVDYDVLNNKYKYYFGDSDDLKKEDYDLTAFTGSLATSMTYSPDDDSFSVLYPGGGVGGAPSLVMVSKVIEVEGTAEKFSATVLSEKATLVGSMMSQNPQFESSDELRESLSAYRFNFVKEDDEYKLMSVEKI